MRHPTLLLTLVAALGAACGRRPAEVTPAAVVPCPLAGVGSADAAWRQVRASGFTFCLPASWVPAGQARDGTDPRRWRDEDGALTWGLGLPLLGAATTYSATGVIVRGNARMSPIAPLPARDNTRDPRACARKNTAVLVEDSSIVITQELCQSTWTLTAWSLSPAMYVQGVAHDIGDAERLLIVLQTIRFSPARR